MLFVLIISLEVLNLGKPLAQQSWQEARFDEFGFAVKIPPGWKIYSTPKPDKASLIVFKNISADLYDDCNITVVPNDAYANLTQEQIDSQVQASLMQYPVPDYSRKESTRKKLEEELNQGSAFPATVRSVDFDKLGGHSSRAYTAIYDHFGKARDEKRFSYVHTLWTPHQQFTVSCNATSHDINAVMREFGSGISSTITPFIASFVMAPPKVDSH